MPEIRYTLRCEGDEFKETALFKRGDARQLVTTEILGPLNATRQKVGEPLLELVQVEVTNPHIHQHKWRHTFKNFSVERSFYVCEHCEVTGYKPLSVISGEKTRDVARDEKFKKDKYAQCRDALKEAPKKLSFN